MVVVAAGNVVVGAGTVVVGFDAPVDELGEGAADVVAVPELDGVVDEVVAVELEPALFEEETLIFKAPGTRVDKPPGDPPPPSGAAPLLTAETELAFSAALSSAASAD